MELEGGWPLPYVHLETRETAWICGPGRFPFWQSKVFAPCGYKKVRISPRADTTSAASIHSAAAAVAPPVGRIGAPAAAGGS